jgi:hypothetical protein
MAVKKKRTVEELEELLKESERKRADHLRHRKSQLEVLRYERGQSFRRFVGLPVLTELNQQVMDALMSDPEIVQNAVTQLTKAIADGNYGYYGRYGHGSQDARGVFTQRPNEDEAVRFQFKHVFDDINRYFHTHQRGIQWYIDPILNRDMKSMDHESKMQVNKMYYPNRHRNSEEQVDFDDVRACLCSSDVVEEVVKHRRIGYSENAEIDYSIRHCEELLNSIRTNVASALAESSKDKSHQLCSVNNKINW